MQRSLLIKSVAAAVVLALSGSAVAAAATGERADDLRDKRYCEILLGYSYAAKMNFKVFNTVGYNYCPQKEMYSFNLKAIAKENAADIATLNGPRHWVLDAIDGGDVSGSGETKNFGGIEMSKVASQTTALSTVKDGGQAAYTTTQVQRTTVWIYDAGKAVFELLDDQGGVYIMQSYSQQVDRTLKMADLPTLGQRLKLPTGWSYRTRVLDQALNLSSNGLATILQDDLKNTYQKI
jgi:hypothetical protein